LEIEERMELDCPHCQTRLCLQAVSYNRFEQGAGDLSCPACGGEWRMVKTQPWKPWEAAFVLRFWRDHPLGHLSFEERLGQVAQELKDRWAQHLAEVASRPVQLALW